MNEQERKLRTVCSVKGSRKQQTIVGVREKNDSLRAHSVCTGRWIQNEASEKEEMRGLASVHSVKRIRQAADNCLRY